MKELSTIHNSNHAVLITGAANRIGKQIAIYFASKGYNIAIHYSNSQETAIITKEEIKAQYNVECEIFRADFLNRTETSNLISEVRSIFEIKHLVNNASIFHENKFSDSGTSDLDIFMEVNFKTPYLLTKQFAQFASEGSCIINILDTKITQNQTKNFDYLLSKKFLEVFTKQVAYELAPKIRVNGIAPGVILPPKNKDENYLKSLVANIPMKSIGSINNITHSIDFLINNEFITGQVIIVDGGENL